MTTVSLLIDIFGGPLSAIGLLLIHLLGPWCLGLGTPPADRHLGHYYLTFAPLLTSLTYKFLLMDYGAPDGPLLGPSLSTIGFLLIDLLGCLGLGTPPSVRPSGPYYLTFGALLTNITYGLWAPVGQLLGP